jgi:four helix bundle protein
MANYHTLKPYKFGLPLASGCARAAARFPDFEQRALADQLRRAAYSVILNIAEGASGGTLKQRVHQLGIARKSVHEVRVILEISRDLGYIEPDESGRLSELCEATGKTLHGYIESLQETIDAIEQLDKNKTPISRGLVSP